MRVLVLGTGGREQAIAWACRRHGHDVRLAGSIGDASANDTDLLVPGPEAALVAGATDIATERGIPSFGPTAALAKLESSKRYARELATSLGIPGPAFAGFDDADTAIAKGTLDYVTSDLSTLLGRPTTPMSSSVAAALRA